MSTVVHGTPSPAGIPSSNSGSLVPAAGTGLTRSSGRSRGEGGSTRSMGSVNAVVEGDIARSGSFVQHTLRGRGRIGGTSMEVPAAFEERVQQLTVLGSRIENNIIVTDAEKAVFDYELRNYHRLGASTVAKILETDTEAGLTAAAAAESIAKHGRNALTPPRQRPLVFKLLVAMFSGFAPLLWVASVLCFIAWQPLGLPNPAVANLALAILLIIIIVVGGVFVFWQEYQTSRVLEGFRNMIPAAAIVMRDGSASTMPATEVTVGDVVLLSPGVKIPADLRISSATDLRVDKSMLTGESEPVKLGAAPTRTTQTALEASNMAFMGTTVVAGTGRGIVVAVGQQCQIGRIAHMTSAPPKVTSLQRDLNRFVLIVGSFAVAFFAIVMIVWGAWLHVDHPSFMPTSAALSNAMGVLVAFVPEGLPLALAAGLTIIAKRLCDKHMVLLKQLATVETLGSMSLLASDKTGTLTQNMMTVVNVVLGPEGRVVAGTEWEAVSTDANFAALVRCAALCNEATIQTGAIESEHATVAVEVNTAMERGASGAPPPFLIVGGNATDRALLAWAAQRGGIEEQRKHLHAAAIPFSSATKQAVSVQVDTSSGVATVYVKGAPDMIVGRCSSILTAAGEAALLPPAAVDIVRASCDALGLRGERVVALCQRVLDVTAFPAGFAFMSDPINFPVDELTLVGLVAVADPPREATAGAVAALRTAGVQVVMVTGDAETTAEAIGRQVGVVTAPVVERPPADLLKVATGGSAEAPTAPARPRLADAMLPPQRDTILTTAAADKSTSEVPKAAPTDVTRVAEATTASASATSPSADQQPCVPRAAVATGPELTRFTAAAWRWLLDHDEIVLARTTPEQKLQFVKEAQSRGHRVGVTGDGVNDAPALKNADVGVAMNSGADAARDAAHVVLLSDDFAAMVPAVREGRLIFANLRKICAYLITGGCWAELIAVLAVFFLGVPQPLSAIMMIAISCLTDVCAGIALVYERPEGRSMQGKARDHRSTRLVDIGLVASQYFFYGMMISFSTFFVFCTLMAERGPVQNSIEFDNPTGMRVGYSPSQLVFAWSWPFNADQVAALTEGSSAFFVTIVVCQLGNYLNVRRRHSPYFSDLPGATPRDKLLALPAYLVPTLPMLCAFVLELSIALLLTETAGLQAILSTASVPARYWGMAIAFSALSFAISEAGKWVVYMNPRSVLRHLYWT